MFVIIPVQVLVRYLVLHWAMSANPLQSMLLFIILFFTTNKLPNVLYQVYWQTPPKMLEILRLAPVSSHHYSTTIRTLPQCLYS